MPREHNSKLQSVADEFERQIQEVLDSWPIEDVRELMREFDFELQQLPNLKLRH